MPKILWLDKFVGTNDDCAHNVFSVLRFCAKQIIWHHAPPAAAVYFARIMWHLRHFHHYAQIYE